MKNKGSFSLFETGFIAGYLYNTEIKLNDPLIIKGFHSGAYQTARDQNYDKYDAKRSFESQFFKPSVSKAWQKYLQVVILEQSKDQVYKLWNEEFDLQSDKAYKEGYRDDNIRLIALKRTNALFGVNSLKELEML